METLPLEMIDHILSFLPTKDWVKCQYVCKDFYWASSKKTKEERRLSYSTMFVYGCTYWERPKCSSCFKNIVMHAKVDGKDYKICVSTYLYKRLDGFVDKVVPFDSNDYEMELHREDIETNLTLDGSICEYYIGPNLDELVRIVPSLKRYKYLDSKLWFQNGLNHMLVD